MTVAEINRLLRRAPFFVVDKEPSLTQRPKIVRSKSKSELQARERITDSASCFHNKSYTMPCRQCKRSKDDARAHSKEILLKISAL
jgi:hypothetical protein